MFHISDLEAAVLEFGSSFDGMSLPASRYIQQQRRKQFENISRSCGHL